MLHTEVEVCPGEKAVFKVAIFKTIRKALGKGQKTKPEDTLILASQAPN